MPYLSSKKPTIARGDEISGWKLPKIEQNVSEVKKKDIPAPVETGFIWELLLFGMSTQFLDKYGIK